MFEETLSTDTFGKWQRHILFMSDHLFIYLYVLQLEKDELSNRVCKSALALFPKLI